MEGGMGGWLEGRREGWREGEREGGRETDRGKCITCYIDKNNHDMVTQTLRLSDDMTKRSNRPAARLLKPFFVAPLAAPYPPSRFHSSHLYIHP